jgi:PAS domain S-box-containing protein
LSGYPFTPGQDAVPQGLLDQLDDALETFPLPVFSVDSRGVSAWQNAAARALFGDLRGQHYEDLVAPEELPSTRERFAKLLLGSSTRRARTTVRSASGELVHVEVSATPLREDGKVVGALGISVPLPSGHERPASSVRLTARQQEVLELLADGKSTAEIAGELHLSPVTVRNYVGALLRTLNAGSRLEAVVTALREGLVSLNPEVGGPEPARDAD